MSEENSEPPPELTLNLPPGYLREYRKLYFQRDFQEQGEAAVPNGAVPNEHAQRILRAEEDSLSESDY